MIISFDKELKTQTYFAYGPEIPGRMGLDRDANGMPISHAPQERVQIALIRDPVLMTDMYRIVLELDEVKRLTIIQLKDRPVHTYEYDGVGMEFEQQRFPTVWGPSIDTLLLCKALGGLDMASVLTAAELGAGSGYACLYLSHKAPTLRQLTAVDLSEEAINCCRQSLTDPRVRFAQQDGLEFLKSHKQDLVFTNPPYLPRPFEQGGSAYEGIGLLRGLIVNAAGYLNPGGRLIINMSQLAERVALEAMGSMNCRVLEQMTVPLKVLNVLNNPAWMDYLMERGLKHDAHNGYSYWHTIKVYEVRA